MKKGVSMLIVTVAISVMLVLISSTIIVGTGTINTAQYEEFLSQINRVSSSANEYFLEYGKLPVKNEFISNVSFGDEFLRELKQNRDENSKLYIIDTYLLNDPTVKRGNGTLENKDIFVISEDTNNVYYLKGFKYKGKIYFGLKNGENDSVDDSMIPEDDPFYDDKYTISNFEQLKAFRDAVNNGSFTGANMDKTVYLIADIDMKNSSFGASIGNTEAFAFDGKFIGNNHKIKNVNLNFNTEGSGLFGYNKGEISKLIIESGNIFSNQKVLGAICGYNYGTISECKNLANVSSENIIIGGIVGQNVSGSNISKCCNKGEVSSSNKIVGGICGYNKGGKIEYSYNTGNLYTQNNQIGGIVGINEGQSTTDKSYVQFCYNIGQVYGYGEVGGIAGDNYVNSYIENSYNVGAVNATTNYDALVAINNQTVTNCYVLKYSCKSSLWAIYQRSADEMKNTSFLNSINGSNNIFVFKENVNYGYPTFEWVNDQDSTIYMPNMDNVTCYFDYKNIGNVSGRWKNLAGKDSIELYDNQVDSRGVIVDGSSTSYAKITHPMYASNVGSTRYLIFKNVSGVYSDWKSILSCETASNYYYASTLAMGLNGNLKYTRWDILPTGKYCSNIYHVVAIRCNASEQRSYLYIDGVLVGSSTGIQGWSDDIYFARGYNWSYGANDDNQTAFKFFAIADTAHTDTQIIQNSNWLLEKYVRQSNQTFLSDKMPNMKSVTCYFDYNNVGNVSGKWKNLVGKDDIELYGAEINSNGVVVAGSATSYAMLNHKFISNTSNKTTRYAVFKNLSGIYADWKTIISCEDPDNYYRVSLIAMDPSGNIKFTRWDIVPSTKYNSSQYHVVAWKHNISQQRTYLWIDGNYIGTATGMQGWSSITYFARGHSWTFNAAADNSTAYRFFAIADDEHTDAEIVENSNWLKAKYCVN